MRAKTSVIRNFCQNQLNVKKWRDIDKVTTKLHDLIGKKPWKEIFTFTVSGNFGDLHVEWNENPGPRTTFEETFGRAILFTNQDTWVLKMLFGGIANKL